MIKFPTYIRNWNCWLF